MDPTLGYSSIMDSWIEKRRRSSKRKKKKGKERKRKNEVGKRYEKKKTDVEMTVRQKSIYLDRFADI